MNALMEMKNINKSFGSNRVLENVNVSLYSGEVLALLGENGAGKSTLIKILGGIYKKDSGQIYVKDQLAEINNISDARTYGISIIHQELMLCSHISVAENIFWTVFQRRDVMVGLEEDISDGRRAAACNGVDD